MRASFPDNRWKKCPEINAAITYLEEGPNGDLTGVGCQKIRETPSYCSQGNQRNDRHNLMGITVSERTGYHQTANTMQEDGRC